jgi:hypothetical protein
MRHLSTARKYYVLFWTDRDGKVTMLKCRIRIKPEQGKLFTMGLLAVLLSVPAPASTSNQDANTYQKAAQHSVQQ